jgi:enterochelin esterase family protein
MARRIKLMTVVLTAALACPALALDQDPARGAPPPVGRAGGRGGGPLKSPEVAADGRATFRLRAPNAREVVVTIAGKRLTMQRDESGLWSATTDALAPDVYTYSFVVDGATITDPANREFQTSFGSAQSMFFVPGPAPWLPAPGVPRGAVARHVFGSAIAGDEREFFVYTPPGYDPKRSQPYPVLYLLHGLGDDAARWVNAGGANHILDNSIASGRAVPMVMVTTLGYGTSQGPAGARGSSAPQNLTGYTEILLDEVLPLVDRSYNVSRNRAQRAIAGLSMGGAEALYTAFKHPDRFAWVGSFSGAFVMWRSLVEPPDPPAARGATPDAARGGRGAAPAMDPAMFATIFPALDARMSSQFRMLWIVCGTDDGLIGVNRQFKDWLRSKNVQFSEQEVPGMAHVWPLWRQNVADMVPKLFK